MKHKLVEHQIQIKTYDDSAFDTYLFLSISPKWRRIVNVLRNGERLTSLKNFNCKIKMCETKTVTQYVQFRYGMTHNMSSFRKIATTYGLQKGLSEKRNG